MRYVRLVKAEHYDVRRKKFVDLAFTPSGDGASVFEYDCAIATSGTVCDHISEFYRGVGGEPAVFWPFDISELDADCRIEYSVSDSDDRCHAEVKGRSKTFLKKALRTLTDAWLVDDLQICADSGLRPLTLEDIPEKDGQ